LLSSIPSLLPLSSLPSSSAVAAGAANNGSLSSRGLPAGEGGPASAVNPLLHAALAATGDAGTGVHTYRSYRSEDAANVNPALNPVPLSARSHHSQHSVNSSHSQHSPSHNTTGNSQLLHSLSSNSNNSNDAPLRPAGISVPQAVDVTDMQSAAMAAAAPGAAAAAGNTAQMAVQHRRLHQSSDAALFSQTHLGGLSSNGSASPTTPGQHPQHRRGYTQSQSQQVMRTLFYMTLKYCSWSSGRWRASIRLPPRLTRRW
jgi:hypothetical protein